VNGPEASRRTSALSRERQAAGATHHREAWCVPGAYGRSVHSTVRGPGCCVAPRPMYNPSMPETNPQQMQPRPHVRGRGWKRTVAAALLLLVGGAVVNVAVAWGCVFAAPATPVSIQWTEEVPSALPESWAYAASEWKGFGSRERRFHVMPAQFGGCGNSPEYEIPGGIRRVLADSNGRVESSDAERSVRYASLYCATIEVVDFGVPFQSVRFEVARPELSEWWPGAPLYPRGATQYGLLVRDNGLEDRPTILPLRPLAPGFIFNTLFYALVLWLLFATPFAARRMVRRRRGQCEKCAYPIGVSPVCTECGAAVSSG